MLWIDLRVGDRIRIGEHVTLCVEHKSGQYARLAIDAPRDVTIRRLIVNDERRPSVRQAPYIPPQTD